MTIVHLKRFEGNLKDLRTLIMREGITQQRAIALHVSRGSDPKFVLYVKDTGVTTAEKKQIQVDEPPSGYVAVTRYFNAMAQKTLGGDTGLLRAFTVEQLEQIVQAFGEVINEKTGRPTRQLHLVGKNSSSAFCLDGAWSETAIKSQGVVVDDYHPEKQIFIGTKLNDGKRTQTILEFDGKSRSSDELAQAAKWDHLTNAAFANPIGSISRVKFDKAGARTMSVTDQVGASRTLKVLPDGTIIWGAPTLEIAIISRVFDATENKYGVIGVANVGGKKQVVELSAAQARQAGGSVAMYATGGQQQAA
ncbi:hypothetical protein FJZ48_01130 [Candidatus Uhrbacteria bacterium]|nr:hypothetical protein [Candidatus Uhrbacteria bacterium]